MNKAKRPPKLFRNAFHLFCADEYYEELEGDLEEAFYENTKTVGGRKARLIYIKEVMLMLRPSVWKKIKTQITHANNIDMFRNYLKVGIRNILSQKLYSFINVFGLAVGMAATILIVLYVQNELSYDQYHEKSDRIYRISREWLNDSGESSLHLGHVAPPFGPLLKNDFEGIVQNAIRFNSGGNPLMVSGDKQFEEERFFWAEADLFEVFSWKLLKGDPKTALTEPNTIILTQSAADKYFGAEEPLNKSIIFKNFGVEVEMKVTGIIEDTPANSHFQFDMLASFVTLENFFGRENMMQNFGSNNYATYLMFPEDYNLAEFQAQLPAFIDKHFGPRESGALASKTNKLHLMPLTDIHLRSHLDSEIETNGNIAYVYTYTIIAIFILMIACINFMNLSTARSAKRSREVGVRKAMGAFRTSLVNQFLAESMLVALLAVILALGFAFLALPGFNNFVDKELVLFGADPTFLLALIFGIVMAVGLVAGSYPAFFLSSFQPAVVLKGTHKTSHQKINLRSILVVIQFFISICLIVGVGIIDDQMEYMKTKDLGFDKDNMIVLPSSNQMYADYQAIKERLQQQPGIEEVTLSSRVPSGRLLDSQGGSAEVDGEMKNISFRIADIHTDHDYLKALKIKFLAGRNFDIELASDSSEAFILNKAAIDGIGWNSAEEAIDKKFNYGGRTGQVIGVVDDFHFESLHQTIAPMVFVVTNGRGRSIVIKLKEGYEEEAMAYLKEQWTFLRPGFPFDFYKISDRFDEQYESDEKLGRLVQYFSLLAIFIAILGLFGLSSFSIEQRLKEIGVRKVMGASVKSLSFLLIKKFTVLVFVGMLFAIPVTYYGMSMWLEGFSYAGAIKPWAFVFGGLFALIFAILTVSYETLKAAYSNPVDTLRNE